MSGQDWPVGTVATATVRGVEGVRVFLIGEDDDPMWMTSHQVDGWYEHGPKAVTDVRPLVVLDLGPVDGADLARVVRSEYDDWAFLGDQIEAQTNPPRIPEPGLWGVVEATLADSDYPRRWIRDGLHDDAQWVALEATMRREWDHLVDPVELRPGIEDEA